MVNVTYIRLDTVDSRTCDADIIVTVSRFSVVIKHGIHRVPGVCGHREVEPTILKCRPHFSRHSLCLLGVMSTVKLALQTSLSSLFQMV